MPVKLRVGAVKLYVYGGEHGLPHVHAIHGDKEARITIDDQVLLTNKGFKQREINDLAKAIAANAAVLMGEWNERNKKA